MNECNTSIHTSEASSSAPRKGGLGPGGWNERITAETLRDPASIERLWQYAVGLKWVESEKRLEFFAVALCVARWSRDRINMRNPGGAFTTRVKAGDWTCASQADYAAARKALEYLERPPPAPLPAEQATPPPAKPIDYEARRKKAEQTLLFLRSSNPKEPEL